MNVLHQLKAAMTLAQEMRQLKKAFGLTSRLMTCPVCGGKVMVRVVPNGHTGGKCETTNCLDWRE